MNGNCDPAFTRVADAFQENFAQRGEVGANVCLYLDGKPVVDLWGGYCDSERTRPWNEDTIVCMMSVAKGMTALCLWLLIDRGEVKLDAPVATYWPEFGCNGKETITVKQVLGHMAGVYYFDIGEAGNCLDWDAAIHGLEQQTPLYTPGSIGGYHSATYGHLVGEIVRRVSGRSPGTFFRQEIAVPLGLDYWIGLPETELDRVAPTFEAEDDDSMAFLADPEGKQGRQFADMPPVPDLFNTREFRMTEFPSANGHGNGRAMARLFGALACGGELDGVRLLQAQSITAATEEQWNGPCWMFDMPMRVSLGFLHRREDNFPIGPSDAAFSTAGAGGSIGFADPQARLGFGYSPNFRCGFGGLGERCEALIQATCACL